MCKAPGVVYHPRRLRIRDRQLEWGEADLCPKKEREIRMSNSFKTVMALCLVAFVAACAGKKEEVVYVEPQPVPAEPVYNKY